MLEKYSAKPSSNHGANCSFRLPFINWWAYSWNTTVHGFSTDMSSMMKLRSLPPWNSPATCVRDHGKVWRPNFHPLRLPREKGRFADERGKQNQRQRPEYRTYPIGANTHRATPV